MRFGVRHWSRIDLPNNHANPYVSKARPFGGLFAFQPSTTVRFSVSNASMYFVKSVGWK